MTYTKPNPQALESHFHLHLVSDATGETLMNVGRAASVQFNAVSPIEHIYPLVRNMESLHHALAEIEAHPGIVLFTLVKPELVEKLEQRCHELGCPTLSVLAPVHNLFKAYLGAETTPRIGAQHLLNAEYFRRIDALNFTLLHDDGQNMETIDQADVILLGISRTSKTPTSIYLANRGIKTANIPLVKHIFASLPIEKLNKTMVIGLIATPERIADIRQNRLLTLNVENKDHEYINRETIQEELMLSKRLFTKQNWPVIDVTRRSVEETAANIMAHIKDYQRNKKA